MPHTVRPASSPVRRSSVRFWSVRVVVQRASEATVSVGGEVIGRLPAPGLVILVGVTHDDTPATAVQLADKVWNLRILEGETSCADVRAPLLVVSQFTLYADTRKGRRPSWSNAAPGPVAEPLVDAFAEALRDRGAHVESGRFGAHMQVRLVNDGPVTLILEA
jgi:D-tyrosyl-tRNA(Tyr) deacylase